MKSGHERRRRLSRVCRSAPAIGGASHGMQQTIGCSGQIGSGAIAADASAALKACGLPLINGVELSEREIQ
jgi:hypothetical protein